MLNSEQKDQRSVVPQCCGISLRSTTDDDSSNAAGYIMQIASANNIHLISSKFLACQ